MRGLASPSPDFTGWLRQVIAYRRQRSPERVQADIQAGLAECLRFGTTLVGDVAASHINWLLLADVPLRAVVFRELLGLSEERAAAAWEQVQLELRVYAPSHTMRMGLSPHAPYSVRSDLFAPSAWQGVAVATHLAESSAELELLSHQRGPFVEFLQELGVWSPEGLVRGPEEVLRRTQSRLPVLYVHGNYLSAGASIPANGSIVYCPRTHAAFGHPPHPFREFLARGVRVALGTDSLASNPDLDLLAEARFVHARHPDVPGATVLRLATLSGAEALGWQDETGSLEPGKSADLVVLPLSEEDRADPHELVLQAARPVQAVLWRGRWRGAAAT
jgi:cytosine/adenosine deaminase-related metal-dependent hydrolase